MAELRALGREQDATLNDVVLAMGAGALDRPDVVERHGEACGQGHLVGELFQQVTGIKLVHVPYKGASQGLTDVIGGNVQVYVSSVPTLIGHIKSGKLRALAVTSAKRTDDLPNVPTVAESGLKGFEATTWFGLLGPAKLPAEVVLAVNAEVNKALRAEDLRKKLGDQGLDITGGTPEQFAKLMRDDLVKWGKVVKESGARAD